MASPKARSQRLPHQPPKSPATTPTPTTRTAAPSATRPETPEAKATSAPSTASPAPALEVPLHSQFTTGTPSLAAKATPADPPDTALATDPEPPPAVGDPVTLVDGNGTPVKDYTILTMTPPDWRGQTRADLGESAQGPAVLHTVLLPGWFARLPTRADAQPTEPPPADAAPLQETNTLPARNESTPPAINAPGSIVASIPVPALDATNAAIQARAARALSGLGFTTQLGAPTAPSTTVGPAPSLTTAPSPKTVATPGGTAPLPNPTPPAAQTIGVLPNPTAPGQAAAAGEYCWPGCTIAHKHAICPPACKGNHLHRFS